MLKRILIMLLVLAGLPTLAVAQESRPNYVGYCMLAQVGIPPQTKVELTFGETRELFTQDDRVYKITYGPSNGLDNALTLTSYNTKTKLMGYATVSAESIPRHLILVEADGPKAIFTCDHWDKQ